MFLKASRNSSLLESLFNKDTGLKAWNFIKRDSSTVFSYEFCAMFQKDLFTEHLRMTTAADSSVATKALSTDPTFFFPSLFYFSLNNCNYGTLFRKCIKIKMFLLPCTIVYQKNSHECCKDIFTSAIICRCTLEKIQIFLGKSRGNCQVPRRIPKTGK